MDATPTTLAIPTDLVEALSSSAALLRKSFKRLGSLNGEQNAPMPERNTVIHLASALLERGFSVYAEPSFFGNEDEGKRRLDLLASDGVETFVVEAKAFGKRNFGAVLKDAQRIADFRPNPDRRIDSIPETGFWNSSRKWGCVVIQSFTRDSINDLWKKQVAAPDEFDSRINEPVDQLLEDEKPGFKKLAKFLQEAEAETGVEFVCKKREFWDCNPLSLLWACFPLPING